CRLRARKKPNAAARPMAMAIHEPLLISIPDEPRGWGRFRQRLNRAVRFLRDARRNRASAFPSFRIGATSRGLHGRGPDGWRTALLHNRARPGWEAETAN